MIRTLVEGYYTTVLFYIVCYVILDSRYINIFVLFYYMICKLDIEDILYQNYYK